MGTKLNHEQKGILDDQLFALREKVVNGVRPFDEVRRALQDIIDGRLAVQTSNGRTAIVTRYAPPSWWCTPEQQLEKAHQLWPDIVLPLPPFTFRPQTETEVLLLHVPWSFDELWSKVVAPEGYTTWQSDGIKIDKVDKRDLHLAPNVPNRTEPVWLAFDPEHGRDTPVDSLWGQSNLAASEVLSALIQFPMWPLAWFDGASAPNLSGYQLKSNGDVSGVPYLDRWDDGRRLELLDGHASTSDENFASPSVREC